MYISIYIFFVTLFQKRFFLHIVIYVVSLSNVNNFRTVIYAQNELANIYLKGQTEYIQNQIDKIRDSVEDRLSRIVWKTTNEVSRRKSTAKAKLKDINLQDRIHLWKQHFENLLGNPPEVTQEPITRIISKQLDIKLGPFTQEELDSVLRKIRNRKAAGLNEIPPEVWKTKHFDAILLRHCKAEYYQNAIDRWMKGYITHFPKNGYLGFSQELPKYNTYVHSGQNIQYATTQPHTTQNWQHT